MKRDPTTLADEAFDVLVVGGGIAGACIAWDAALRGFRTALVERTDFGHGTSANCFKIVHGGLRYLRHLDLRRMRESIRDRSTWLRSAPHLVEPLAFVVPTRDRGLERRFLLRAALALNDVISADRNRGLATERCLPRGRTCARAEAAELLPGRLPPGTTGAAVFHDAQMYSPQRLVLEVVRAASDAGACVMNHVEFLRPSIRDGRIIGGRIRDRLRGLDFDVRARMVVNAAGPAAPSIAAAIAGRPTAVPVRYSVALNLVLRRPAHPVAFAMAGTRPDDPSAVVRTGGRKLLFMPWRGHQLVGTAHYEMDGPPAEFRLREEHVTRFLAEANRAWPGPPFEADEVALVHAGLLPSEPPTGEPGAAVRLLKQRRIHDHVDDGVGGALSVVTVKFTTARSVAEDVVDRVAAKLGSRAACRTAGTALPGARGPDWSTLADTARRRHADVLPDEVLDHLLRTYGTEYERILAYRSEVPGWDRRIAPPSPVIRAQLVHGTRHEMAATPEDLIDRRTEVGPRGLPRAAARSEAERVLRQESRTAAAS